MINFKYYLLLIPLLGLISCFSTNEKKNDNLFATQTSISKTEPTIISPTLKTESTNIIDTSATKKAQDNITVTVNNESETNENLTVTLVPYETPNIKEQTIKEIDFIINEYIILATYCVTEESPQSRPIPKHCNASFLDPISGNTLWQSEVNQNVESILKREGINTFVAIVRNGDDSFLLEINANDKFREKILASLPNNYHTRKILAVSDNGKEIIWQRLSNEYGFDIPLPSTFLYKIEKNDLITLHNLKVTELADGYETEYVKNIDFNHINKNILSTLVNEPVSKIKIQSYSSDNGNSEKEIFLPFDNNFANFKWLSSINKFVVCHENNKGLNLWLTTDTDKLIPLLSKPISLNNSYLPHSCSFNSTHVDTSSLLLTYEIPSKTEDFKRDIIGTVIDYKLGTIIESFIIENRPNTVIRCCDLKSEGATFTLRSTQGKNEDQIRCSQLFFHEFNSNTNHFLGETCKKLFIKLNNEQPATHLDSLKWITQKNN